MTAVATICPPGTFRSLLGEVTGMSGLGTGVICAGCPQGTWSKNWELRDEGECNRCPTGIVCPIDGMTRPCTQSDFPIPYVPTNAGESQFQCIKKALHFYGRLAEPIDDLKRGPNFISAEVGAPGECFFNEQPIGSVIYQRYKDYHGPIYPIQTKGNFHQGYGDLSYEGYFGRGSLYIDLPVARVFNPGRNCTAGYFVYNVTKSAEVGVAVDDWIVGTCEADIFCNYESTAQAQACSEGYVCDEGTTALTATSVLCPEGYVCDFGTTPDVSLEAPRSKFTQMCPEGYECAPGTGEGQKFRSMCPSGFFCPAGSGRTMYGRMANDALNRGLLAKTLIHSFHRIYMKTFYYLVS
jgi:hypothetical protein